MLALYRLFYLLIYLADGSALLPLQPPWFSSSAPTRREPTTPTPRPRAAPPSASLPAGRKNLLCGAREGVQD